MNGSTLQQIQNDVIHCERCPRLRMHCQQIAREKRRQFRNETYWGKPVPGWGDPGARVLILGLAPAAHGGNRTGRAFTGDNSGLWLYRAIHRAGFSNQARSEGREDGLQLNDIYITMAAHCAPPENKPTQQELIECSGYLVKEIAALTKVQAFLVLGQIALKALWAVLPTELKPQKALPKFSHGSEVRLLDGRVLICSYHPSQQNTFTGKLTEPMLDRVFQQIVDACSASK
jgi:uracil-DNA glycosylase family 4